MVQGTIVLGGDMGPGADSYLVGGGWEARQRTFVPALGSTSLAAVKTGTFARGSTVEVFAGRSPAVVFGHVTPSLTADPPGFVTTLVSEAGRVDLRLRYYGRPGYPTLRPSLIDTVLASPMLLAASIVVTLLASAKDLLLRPAGPGPRRLRRPVRGRRR